MYNNKYTLGNNYVFENGKTFKYNGRRFDGTGKYIGDSFTSVPNYHNDVINQIYTNYDSYNDPNINARNIRETAKIYQGKKYNNKPKSRKSIEAERVTLCNNIRQKHREEKKVFTKQEKQEHQRISKSKMLSNRLENFSIASNSAKKKKNIPPRNRLFGS